MTLSDNNLQDILNYIKERNKNLKKNNNNNTYEGNNERFQVQYGEEMYGYIPYSNNDLARSVLEKDPYYHVKSITGDITASYFEGEPRFQDLVAEMYKDLTNYRKSLGLKGMQGINMKGLVCALLYFVILHYEKTRVDLEKLIKTANTIRGTSTTKVTMRMVNKYMIMIVDSIQKNNTNNENIRVLSLHEEVKRLALILRYKSQDVMELKKRTNNLMIEKPYLIEYHRPTTIAQGIVYIYTFSNPRPNAKKRLKITPYIDNIVIPKITNVSLIMT